MPRSSEDLYELSFRWALAMRNLLFTSTAKADSSQLKLLGMTMLKSNRNGAAKAAPLLKLVTGTAEAVRSRTLPRKPGLRPSPSAAKC
jgi:hypothetical protein